jgi:hypothetical protein
VTIAREVDWYLRDVVRLGNGRARVDAPTTAAPLSLRDVTDALTDPMVLLRGLEIDAVRERMGRLIRFALWLEHTENVAAELASRAARYRFLVWSLPLRFPADRFDEVCPLAVAWQNRTATSPDVVAERARAARAGWMGLLAIADDDPWLAALQAAGDPIIERDLRWVTLAWPERRPGAAPDLGAPLTLPDPGTPAKPWRNQHRSVAADLAEIHWLPRGSLLHAVAAFGWPRRWRLPALAAFPLACAIIAMLLLVEQGDIARWSALALLGAAGLTVAVGLPGRADAIALLRIPAAAGAGQALLLSLTPRWWLSPNGWAIGTAMLVAVALYILLEARLHGAERWLATGRAILIAAIGALYGFVLSVVFLGFVVPAMGEDGNCLGGWWNAHPLEPFPLRDACANDLGQPAAAWPLGILLLMTGWSFAIGTAAQILWDDRPLTAPLGRLRRVRGAKP